MCVRDVGAGSAGGAGMPMKSLAGGGGGSRGMDAGIQKESGSVEWH